MKKKVTILVGSLCFILIIFSIYRYFSPPISNIKKHLGNPDKIINITITNKDTDTTIILSDPASISLFCNTINELTFNKIEPIKFSSYSNEAKYYIAITTNTDHFIQTHLPRGRLFRGLKDKGIISPDFEVKDILPFDEWFENNLVIGDE